MRTCDYLNSYMAVKFKEISDRLRERFWIKEVYPCKSVDIECHAELVRHPNLSVKAVLGMQSGFELPDQNVEKFFQVSILVDDVERASNRFKVDCEYADMKHEFDEIKRAIDIAAIKTKHWIEEIL